MTTLEEAMSPYVEAETINCAQCFEVARTTTASLKEIGRFCDDNGIKIHNCQLGCFP